MPDYVHTPEDGRGPRDVFLDGAKVEWCVFADEKNGRVRVVRKPAKLDKTGKRLLTKTLRGKVEVRPRDRA